MLARSDGSSTVILNVTVSPSLSLYIAFPVFLNKKFTFDLGKYTSAWAKCQGQNFLRQVKFCRAWPGVLYAWCGFIDTVIGCENTLWYTCGGPRESHAICSLGTAPSRNIIARDHEAHDRLLRKITTKKNLT
jgi:hypothetical protein